ncbi:MAG: hypothetical protein K6G56_03965 [Clostridiales bacterium]|nr:hypothetical protein [Clostridiales bacterium]
MNPELSGKRLLILGGSLWKKAIKDFAAENNITLIATGNDQSAGIFEIADEKFSVNSTDPEAMKKLIRDAKIDGVYMGGSEPVISSACQYINDLGLPCYCTHEQWEYLQNKRNFKDLCVKHGLPVTPRYTREDLMQGNEDLFPVITKPADGCGSSGFSICRKPDELDNGIELARRNSPSNTEIIEKYVSNDAVCVFYTFSDGRGIFSGSEDKYPVKYPNGGFVGGLYIFRSFEEASFRQKYEDSILALFEDIGVKEGCIWIEIFRDRGNYYFNEIGYRVGGTVSVFPVAYMSGYNQVATDVYYALTGKSVLLTRPSLIMDDIPRDRKYCVYTVHVRPGIVGSYEGESQLIEKHPNIVTIARTKNIGSLVPDTGTFAQVAALIHFVYKDNEELRQTIDDIHKYLLIRNTNGENMIMRMVDDQQVSRIEKGYCL